MSMKLLMKFVVEIQQFFTSFQDSYEFSITVTGIDRIPGMSLISSNS